MKDQKRVAVRKDKTGNDDNIGSKEANILELEGRIPLGGDGGDALHLLHKVGGEDGGIVQGAKGELLVDLGQIGAMKRRC